jgi:hypothetical protein
MTPEHVAAALIAGLKAYGVVADAEIEPRPDGRWGMSLNFEPDGLLLEGLEASRTMRVMWSGGTDDEASLGKALDYCVREAGQPLREPRPRLFRRQGTGNR